jgi:hypothetical protein
VLLGRSDTPAGPSLRPSPRNASATTIEVYDATPTPVQIVASDNTTWFNVHLYVLVDTGDASDVAQGGAFWRWGNTGEWQAAPVPLYDEHQIDPVVRNSTRRGYNIAWGQSLIGPTAGSMQFRVWAIGPHDVAPVETVVSKPAIVVTLPPAPASNLSLSLFKAVAFSGGADEGVHAHLVINAWPPQSPVPPDYQLFAEVLIQLQHGTALLRQLHPTLLPRGLHAAPSKPAHLPARPLRLKLAFIGRQDLNGITSVALLRPQVKRNGSRQARLVPSSTRTTKPPSPQAARLARYLGTT